MTCMIEKEMSEIRALMPELNATCDKAARLVRRVEASFAMLGGLGTVQTDPFDLRPDDPGIYRLSYGRIGGNYRVGVVETIGNLFETTPWSDCSRELRLRSFVHLPDLIVRIGEKAKRLAEAAHRARETILANRAMFGPGELAEM